VPQQVLIHVHPDPDELGRVYKPQLAIACGVCDFSGALASVESLAPGKRTPWLREAREAYVKFSTPPPPAEHFVDRSAVVGWLSEHLAGDGCFLMYPQEIATAVQQQANLVIIIVNNAMYGTIRMHQENRFPGRAVDSGRPGVLELLVDPAEISPMFRLLV